MDAQHPSTATDLPQTEPDARPGATAVAELAPAAPVEVAINADAPTEPAPTVAPIPTNIDLATLAEQIEALLISSPRPVPPSRLGQALGLIAPDQPLLENAEATPAPDADGTQAVPAPKAKRSRKPKAGPDPLALIEQAVNLLNEQYAAGNRQFRIEKLAGNYRVMIAARHRKALEAFHGTQASGRLSKAGVETLAIIAYKQPITRAKLEAIRGVACGEVLRSLLERRLITIVGRAEELGRPMLYGTTRQFLEAFGLASLKDLPAPAEFATLKRA